MKSRFKFLISTLLIMLAVLLTGTVGDITSVLPGKEVTYESSKPEAAKKKKNKKKKSENSTSSTGSTENEGSTGNADSTDNKTSAASVREDGTYTTKDEVAAYIHEFGHLHSNFITKKEAKSLGWVSNQGNLGEVAPGKSIGGDYFGNYEELLPVKSGRSYYECDIDSTGGYRGAKRIIFSNDGLIFYTEDHYNSFEQLY